jgi:hypothetical protein
VYAGCTRLGIEATAHAKQRGNEMTQVQKIAAELLQMNKDALAALVTLGAKAGDPLQFVTDATDRFVVARLLVTVR